MPVREKPEFSGDGERFVEQWTLKNSAKTFDAASFTKFANETRSASVAQIGKFIERADKSSND